MTTFALPRAFKLEYLLFFPLVACLVAGKPHMAAATIAYGCMIQGFLQRRRSQTQHVIWMAAAIIIDLALVLTLEIQRHAVATATAFTLHPLQQAHVAFSLLAVTAYVPLVALGLLRLSYGAGRDAALWHRRLGWFALICRTAGYVLMFSMGLPA